MRYVIVSRSQHQVGGQFGGPNAYMALVRVPDGQPSPGELGSFRGALSAANMRRYGWVIIASAEYYADGRLANAGIRTRERLLSLIPEAAE